MQKRSILLATYLSLATQFAVAMQEPLRPPTGSLAVPASEIVLSAKFSYFSNLSTNGESAKSFMQVWLGELQLTFLDTLEFIKNGQKPEDFVLVDARHGDYGRTLVASKFESHDLYVRSGLYRLPLVLLGTLDEATAAELQKQLVEHFKLSHELVKKAKNQELQAEFTSVGMLEHLARPSVYGAAIDGFADHLYIQRSLEVILEAGKKGYLNPRVVGHVTGEIMDMLARLYRDKPAQLHLIYSSQEISTLIRKIAALPGGDSDLVIAAEQSLLGLSCEMLLQATSARH